MQVRLPSSGIGCTLYFFGFLAVSMLVVVVVMAAAGSSAEAFVGMLLLTWLAGVVAFSVYYLVRVRSVGARQSSVDLIDQEGEPVRRLGRRSPATIVGSVRDAVFDLGDGEFGDSATFSYVDAVGRRTSRRIVNWMSVGNYVRGTCVQRHAQRTFRKDRISGWRSF